MLTNEFGFTQVVNDLDVAVEVTVDITGSSGVGFSGPFDSKMLQKTQRVEANSSESLAQLRLFGDWELKIRFTYLIIDVSDERAKQIQLEPSKTRARHQEEEIKQQ